jgi:hypothetical protein
MNIYVHTNVMRLCIAMEPKLLFTFVMYVCGKYSWGILKKKWPIVCGRFDNAHLETLKKSC